MTLGICSIETAAKLTDIEAQWGYTKKMILKKEILCKLEASIKLRFVTQTLNCTTIDSIVVSVNSRLTKTGQKATKIVGRCKKYNEFVLSIS